MAGTILYDIGRLIDRLRAPTPTGIDRIDLRYLLHFLDRGQTPVIGVAIRRGKMIALPDRYLRETADLARRQWMHGQALHSTVWIARAKMRFWMALQRRISGRVDRRVAQASGPLTYVNAAHSHHGGDGPFAEIALQPNTQIVIYVHDLIPVEHPEFVRPGHENRHAKLMKLTAARATQVLTNSQTTAARFSAFCSGAGIAPPPIDVLHPGVEPYFVHAAQPQNNTTDRLYFVALGTQEPRKNITMLLEIWQDARAGGHPLPELRLIGRNGWTTSANANDAGLIAKAAGNVKVLSGLPDTEIVKQLVGARALLLPSQAEGWGLPLVEACALGVPAIASDLSALREAAQDRALFVAASDKTAWETAIRNFASGNSPSYAVAQRALYDFAPPLWDDHFEKLNALLNRG